MPLKEVAEKLLELGFSKAVNFIAEVKGERLPTFLTREDVGKMLEVELRVVRNECFQSSAVCD
jgi:hypothetical protein